MNKLSVTTHGDGPRLACLHGWGLSSRIWSPLVERLEQRLRVQTVDLPGHGDSPAGAAGLEDWTEAVLASIETPKVLLGWSLGGLVALHAAQRWPEAVQGLVLVATLPRMVRTADWRWGMNSDAVEATGRGLESDFEGTLRGFLKQQVLSEPGAGPVVRGLQDDVLAVRPDPAGLAAGLDLLHEADLRNKLPAITCPALVVAGERDRIAHPDGMAWMAKQMPAATYWQVTGSAHAPFLSHADEFADRTAAFVAGL